MAHRMSVTLVAALGMLAGCPDPPTEPAAAAPEVALPPAENAELVADIQHLLQEVQRGQVARDRLLAKRSWQGAWDRFERHVLPSLRQQEASTALKAEYGFGVIAHGIEQGRRTDEAIRWLDGILESERTRWLAIDDP